MYTLPAYYYPTTIAWIDDDALFLDAITQLFSSNQTMKTFTDPKECIRFFQHDMDSVSKNNFLKSCKEHEYFHTAHHSPVSLDVSDITTLQTSYSSETSIIIIDYSMPNMNGLELAKTLAHHPAKKILLTGNANHQNAIDAFNNNSIDRFIRKDSPYIAHEIQTFTTDLMQQYFITKTQPVLSHLETNQPLPQSDTKFSDLFTKICKQHSIEKYSIIDKNGSMTLTNQNNDILNLIIHTDRSLETFLMLNDDIDGIDDLKSLIKSRKKIPFFGIGREPWEFEEATWARYFYDAHVFEGREKYYYTLIK